MSPAPSSRANAPKPASEAALEPKALRRAGRWRVIRQVALRMRYAKPWGEAMHHFQNPACQGSPGASRGLQGPPGAGVSKKPLLVAPSSVSQTFQELCRASQALAQLQEKRFDPAHLLRRVHLFRSRLEASSQGSNKRELEASSQTQTQTLHLPGLDRSTWFKAGRPRARLHLNKHKKPRARPSPNPEKGFHPDQAC